MSVIVIISILELRKLRLRKMKKPPCATANFWLSWGLCWTALPCGYFWKMIDVFNSKDRSPQSKDPYERFCGPLGFPSEPSSDPDTAMKLVCWRDPPLLLPKIRPALFGTPQAWSLRSPRETHLCSTQRTKTNKQKRAGIRIRSASLGWWENFRYECQKELEWVNLGKVFVEKVCVEWRE